MFFGKVEIALVASSDRFILAGGKDSQGAALLGVLKVLELRC